MITNAVSRVHRRHAHTVRSLLLRACTFALALLWVPHIAAHAQRSTLRFDRLATEHGLSDNYVLCSLQDRYGFIWFGTRDGLNRYDGRTFKIYRHDVLDTTSLSDGSVNTLFEDSSGELWIGTHGGGLNRFDRVRERFIHYKPAQAGGSAVAQGRISAICEDNDGNLWFAATTAPRELSRLDRTRKRLVRFQHEPRDPSSLSSSNIASLCRDSRGTIWVGTTDGGINRYDPRTGGFINRSRHPEYAAAATGPIEHLLAGSGDTLWMLSDGRLMIFRTSTGSTSPAGYDIAYNPVRRDYINSIFLDRTGMLWIGSTTSGLMIARPGSPPLRAQSDPYNPQSLSSDRIFFINEDRSGNVWVGTDNGLNKFNRQNWQFHHYHYDPSDPHGLSHRVVRSILRDSHGILWIGTGSGGLNRIDDVGRALHYRSYPKLRHSLSEDVVNVLYEDRSGELWIGTNHGLNRYRRETDDFLQIHHRPGDSTSLPLGGIWALLEDRDGSMWVGILGGGLCRFDRTTGRFTRYEHDPRNPTSISHNIVLSLHEDRRGRLWIGTDGGLNLFDRRSKTFRRYTHDPLDTTSISNNRVWYMHEDAEGILWLATSGGGMNRFDPEAGTFRHYTEREGLANNTVCGIVEDRRGRLWISTNKGMSRLDRETGLFRSFTAHDGLFVHEFHFKACYEDDDGHIYFGGNNGVIRFHPDSIIDNRRLPPVVLTSFRLFDRELRLDTTIALKRHIRLDHDSNFFTIEFASLDFTNPLRNNYRYKLEGFDADWQPVAGNRPYAVYTNVPPGSYRFRVQGTNNDGVWNLEGTELAITIAPAFWQTWWFTAGVVLVGGTLLGAGMVMRVRSIKRKAELERKLIEYQLKALRAQMSPHFIFNSLNSILHFITSHDSESAHHYLSKFAKLIRATLESSKNDSVTLADEIESLLFYLDLESLRFDGSFTYRIRVDTSIDPQEVEIPPMLIQPHAENAIKYGLAHREPGGSVTIDIRRDGQWLVCSVIDNGVGRKHAGELADLHPPGHRSRGMEVTRERLDVMTLLHKQQYRLDVIDLVDDCDNPAGTRVDIFIPIED